MFKSAVMELPEVVSSVVIRVLEHAEEIKDPNVIANCIITIVVKVALNLDIGEPGDAGNLTPCDVKEIGSIDSHGVAFTVGDGYRYKEVAEVPFVIIVPPRHIGTT